MDYIYGDACKVVSDFNGSIRSWDINHGRNKGQVLYRVRVHLKVPGWFSDLNALLTRKLAMLLSRLNDLSGGRGNICLVSGSLRRVLQFLTARFVNGMWGWVEFCWLLRSVTFTLRFLDRFLGYNVCLGWQRTQGSHVFRKTGTFPRTCC